MLIRLTAAMLLPLCFFAACQTTESDNNTSSSLPVDVPPVSTGNWYQPAIQVSWQWQLSGTLNTDYAVELYDVDLFETSAEVIASLQDNGHRVICYFSAGSYEDWRDDVAAIPASALGNTLDGWDDERWFDVRIDAVHKLVVTRLQLAADKGCDGVEPDNVDGYQNNTGFELTADDQLAFNRYFANQAHELGLAVALKNDLDQIADLVSYFDFAVNEQCFEYNECDRLTAFTQAGKPVLNAEYDESLVTSASERQALCDNANQRQFSTLILPLDLDDAFRYSCF